MEAIGILVGKRKGHQWTAEEAQGVLEVVSVGEPWKATDKKKSEVWEGLVDRMNLRCFKMYQGVPLN